MKAAVSGALRGRLLAVLVSIEALLSGLVPIGLSWLSAPIEQAVQDASGLIVDLNGPLNSRSPLW